MLKMADKESWLAVTKYAADPLCDNDEDDKRWKAAVKEAKEELAKKKSSGYGYSSRSRERESDIKTFPHKFSTNYPSED